MLKSQGAKKPRHEQHVERRKGTGHAVQTEPRAARGRNQPDSMHRSSDSAVRAARPFLFQGAHNSGARGLDAETVVSGAWWQRRWHGQQERH